MIGIYKITHKHTGEYYIGSSKDVQRRFTEHLCRLRNSGQFDCGWIPTDKDEHNYNFIILDECSIDEMVMLESFYLETASPVLCKNIKNGSESKSNRCVNPMSDKCWCNNGITSKVFPKNDIPEGWLKGCVTGIDGLLASKHGNDKGPNSYESFVHNSTPKSEYIDTKDLDIKILSNNDFVPLHGILYNNKKISNPLLEVVYLYKNKVNRSIVITTDHPIVTQKGRTKAEDLNIGDTLFDSVDGDQYEILQINSIQKKSVTYDVETDNDLFDLSGILSHNCRTRVIGNTYDPSNEIVTGRGNLSFTTINLPRIAIESGKDINKFFELLIETLNLVSNQLFIRFISQCNKKIKNYPFLMGQGVWINSEKLNMDDDLKEVLSNGTLSVGFIGLAETLIFLTGKHHGECSKSQQLGLEIVSKMRSFCDEKCREYQLNYSLLATPAEGLSGRFVKLDAQKYGVIKGVTDKDYYTNSFHVPVYYNTTIKNKLDVESPYHALTNAGHISYVELDGDPSQNLESFEGIIRYMKQIGIGYGSINHPLDRDPVCGYLGIIGDTCPNCGRKSGEPLTPKVYREMLAKRRLSERTVF